MIPAKMRLDNASNVYSASLKKNYAVLFRMSVTLSEPVNLNYLQQALNNTIKRIPSFGYTLSDGFFWWYLKKINRYPTVSKYSSLTTHGFKFRGGFLFKLSADDKRIVLDVFHALTDGTGAQTFLLTVTAEYLRLRYKAEIDYSVNPKILNPQDAPDSESAHDSFRDFHGKKGSLEHNDAAYHLKGHKTCICKLGNERIVLETSEVKPVAEKYGCTITELLTAAMVCALQEIRKREKNKRAKTALKVSVPVNLRPIFKSNTLRNFSSYINLGVDTMNGYFDFEEVLQIICAQKKMLILNSELEKKVGANVSLEDSFAVSAIPLFIKRHIVYLIYRIKGDKFVSSTFSNLGNVVLPATMQNYVKEMDFVLGRMCGASGAIAGVGYNGKIFLNSSRNIVEADYEKEFVSQLQKLGINATRTSQELGR